MRTRLLALLLALMAAVLLALGVPLAASRADSRQQELVRDRVDDTARFASDAQLTIVSDSELVRPEEDNNGNEELRSLAGQLKRYDEVYGIRAGVFNLTGEPLAVSRPGYALPLDRHSRAAFAEALAGRRSEDPPRVLPWEDDRIIVAAPVIHRGDVIAVVVTDSPTGRLRSRVLNDWLLLAAGEAVALLAALVLAARLTGWALRPIRTLDAATHEIATGRLGARVAAAQGPIELRRLARSFNEMADNVETVVGQQRAFAADASHQLRNPLAALMLRIEELGYDLEGDHEEVLDGLREEGRRFTRVLDGLLALALAENDANTAYDGSTRIDVAALLRERIDGWGPVARSRDQRFDLVGPAALTAAADAVALGSALDAILDNALKFSPDGAVVTAGVAAAGDRVEIRVADQGPGLNFEEMRRVGDRFWRSPRHQNVDGTGLGLSIARTLLRASGGTLEFGADGGPGLTVTVSVPRGS